MLILGIDSATMTLGMALVSRDEGGVDRVLEARSYPPPASHSALLPREIEAMLGRAGHSLDDLGAMVVGLGPGSFTGLRVALASARAICFARQIPLIGASSLEAMAREAASRGGLSTGDLLVPLLDARKGEVYGGFFRLASEGLSVEMSEFVLPPEALVDRLQKEARAFAFGPGRDAYAALHSLLRLPALDHDASDPKGAKDGAAAFPAVVHLIASVQSIPGYSRDGIFALEPHYVRPSDVEWKRPQL